MSIGLVVFLLQSEIFRSFKCSASGDDQSASPLWKCSGKTTHCVLFSTFFNGLLFLAIITFEWSKTVRWKCWWIKLSFSHPGTRLRGIESRFDFFRRSGRTSHADVLYDARSKTMHRSMKVNVASFSPSSDYVSLSGTSLFTNIYQSHTPVQSVGTRNLQLYDSMYSGSIVSSSLDRWHFAIDSRNNAQIFCCTISLSCRIGRKHFPMTSELHRWWLNLNVWRTKSFVLIPFSSQTWNCYCRKSCPK